EVTSFAQRSVRAAQRDVSTATGTASWNPKPDGGERKPGIPIVLDRLIQQAILQVLQGRYDPTFSEHSDGFRPGRSAHQLEEWADAVRAIASPGCVPLPRGHRCRGKVWMLAQGSPCDGTAGHSQRLLRLARPSSIAASPIA